MHVESYKFVKKVVDQYGPFNSVVDLGGRNVNGTPRDLFPDASYFAVDIVKGEGVDAVADAADWEPTEDQHFDCVVSTETLEHTARVRDIVFNAAKILKDGGRAIFTCASSPRMPHSAIDGAALRAGEYYSNVEPETLLHYMQEAGFTDIETEKHIYPDHGGDLYATGVIDVSQTTNTT